MKPTHSVLQNRLNRLVKKFETFRGAQVKKMMLMEEMRKIKHALANDGSPSEADIEKQRELAAFEKMALNETEMGAFSPRSSGHRPPN